MIVNDTFVYWATEREKIRQRRALNQPRETWTDDPIMRAYRFCNVSREDDRTTIWIKENVRDTYDQDGDEKQLFLAMAVCRFFNLPESLGLLVNEGILVPGKELDLHALHDCLQDYKDDDKKHRVFASAYMVGAPDNHRTYRFGTEKIAYVCGVLSDATPPEARTREGYVTELNKQFGFANFMSGQIAADMAYTFILKDAPDHMTWAPRGPGAVRGMNRALGRDKDKTMSQAEYVEVGKLQMSMLPKDLVEDRRLTLHDVASNVNCETDKYLRGGGTRRFK
jgi:hypothetical protein